MSALAWGFAGAAELASRAARSPWFWNILQLYLTGEQEVEIHHLKEAYERLGQGQEVDPPIGDVQQRPCIGSAMWIEEQEHLETELAAWPEGNCKCP